jgi:hypothetical protein
MNQFLGVPFREREGQESEKNTNLKSLISTAPS